MLKVTLLLSWPKIPLPAGTLLMSALTVTLVPARQNFAGRQCTSVSLIQCHAPFCAGCETTFRCFSIDALSVTGTSKRTITGIPMPTVWPLSGAIDGKVCWSRVSPVVRKWVVLRIDVPPSIDAWLTTVYAVPGSSSAPAVQVLWFAESFPGTGPDLDVTATEVRVPVSAVTDTTRSTGTFVAPPPTLVCTDGLTTSG